MKKIKSSFLLLTLLSLTLAGCGGGNGGVPPFIPGHSTSQFNPSVVPSQDSNNPVTDSSSSGPNSGSSDPDQPGGSSLSDYGLNWVGMSQMDDEKFKILYKDFCNWVL